MSDTFDRYAAEASAALDQKSVPDADCTRQLAEIGARMLRTHNLRKQDTDRARVVAAKPGDCPVADSADDDSRMPAAMQRAAIAWQEANMCAAAGETLLSRIIGAHQGGLRPTAMPDLIAEVVEMRARATDLLYQVLLLVR